MKATMRTLLVLTLCLLVGSAIASAQTVTFWSPFTGPDGVVVEQMVDEFNSTVGASEGVEVELLIVPWDDYYTNLTVAISSGTGPDLAVLHSDRIAGFARQRALQEFRPETLAELNISGEDFIEALWEAGEVNGTRYAIPIDAFPRHIFYNRELFRQAGLDPDNPPTTLEEVIAAGEAISALGDNIWGLWFAIDGSWAYRDFLAFYWQFADELLNDDYTDVSPEFRDAAIQVLDIMTDLIHERGLASAVPSSFEALMAQGRVGISFAQITHVMALNDAPDLDFAGGVLPQFGDKKATFALGHNFVMPMKPRQSAAVREAAQVFIDWFTQEGYAWAAGGKVPAKVSVMEDPRFADLQSQVAAASQLDYMRTPPTIAQMPNVFSAIQENVEAVYAKAVSVEQGVDNMIRDIRSALSR